MDAEKRDLVYVNGGLLFIPMYKICIDRYMEFINRSNSVRATSANITIYVSALLAFQNQVIIVHYPHVFI